MPTIKSSPPPALMGAAAAPRPPKRYDEAFQRQAVENWIRSGRPNTQLARKLGIRDPALKDWKRRCDGDATPTSPNLVAENRAPAVAGATRHSKLPQAEGAWAAKNSGHPLRNTQERSQRIQAMKSEHSLAAWCAAFDVTRSSHRAWATRADCSTRCPIRQRRAPRRAGRRRDRAEYEPGWQPV